MLASTASVRISVSSVLAVETSWCMVHRRCHRALVARMPEALCPLSLEIYEDPVMAADGFSYERREIQAWFDRGKRTSPKTNEELPHTFLTPNRDLKSACQDFLDDVRKFEAR